MAQKFTPKHTPGPWIDEESQCGTQIICDANGVFVAGIGVRDSNQEHDANARLIAAAPDLLEALREVTEVLDMALGASLALLPAGADGPAAKAHAAIARATGEQQ